MQINTSSTMGHHNIVQLNWNNVKDEDGQEKKVAVVNEETLNDGFSGLSTRIYDIPWSREVFEEMMKHTKDDKVSLAISVLSKNKHYGVRSKEEFVADDINSIIERNEKPQPTNQYNFNISPDQLAAFMKYQAEHSKDPQYQ